MTGQSLPLLCFVCNVFLFVSVVWASLCLVSFIGLLHECPVFLFRVPSDTIFRGFFVFVALIFVEAGFDTPAKLAAWCPSVFGEPIL